MYSNEGNQKSHRGYDERSRLNPPSSSKSTQQQNGNISKNVGEARRARDLEMARDAYQKGDLELSKAVHAKRISSHGGYGAGNEYISPSSSKEEGHIVGGDLVKSIVFGGLDGILTTFSIVSGANGGGLGTEVILVLGFSNKIADALSMGLGDALSTKAEHEYILMERQRERWELENFPEGEIEEMVDLYRERGMSLEDAEVCVKLMSKHKDFFINVMMVEELGLQVPDENENPWYDGLITFLSFIFFGFLPLGGYLIFPIMFPNISGNMLFLIACAATGFTLFLLGAYKAKFSGRSWLYSGVEMAIVGGVVAAVAYVVGSVTEDILEADFAKNGWQELPS